MMSFGMSSMMNCSKLCALTLVLISLALADNEPIDYFYPNTYESHKIDTRSMRVCGSQLVKALALACNGKYNRKRSPFSPEESNRIEDSSDHKNGFLSSDDGLEPHSPKYSLALLKLFNNNNNDLKHFQRSLRGVADDCCKKSCTISTLEGYCGST